MTVTLKAVSVGTEINIEQAGLPTTIPVEACYLGWQQSLSQLAQLVEPKFPNSVPRAHRGWCHRAAGQGRHAKKWESKTFQGFPWRSVHEFPTAYGWSVCSLTDLVGSPLSDEVGLC